MNNQTQSVKSILNMLLDKAIKYKTLETEQVTKKIIYDMLEINYNIPRPTIRRITRDYRNDLQKKIDILSSVDPWGNLKK